MKTSSFFTDKFNAIKVTPIIENEYFKEIRIAMQQGAILKEHKAPSAIIVHILQGEIEFKVEQEIFILKEFDFITLAPNKTHSLQANKDSIVRLSLSKSDGSDRVFKLLR